MSELGDNWVPLEGRMKTQVLVNMDNANQIIEDDELRGIIIFSDGSELEVREHLALIFKKIKGE